VHFSENLLFCGTKYGIKVSKIESSSVKIQFLLKINCFYINFLKIISSWQSGP